jgi:hypothetical protein
VNLIIISFHQKISVLNAWISVMAARVIKYAQIARYSYTKINKNRSKPNLKFKFCKKIIYFFLHLNVNAPSVITETSLPKIARVWFLKLFFNFL